MKAFGCLLCFVGVLFMSFNCFSNGGLRIVDGNTMTKTRSMKENNYVGDVNLEDYGPIDPPPSSKASIHGPIEHGTPMIPYVPKPGTSPPAPSPSDND